MFLDFFDLKCLRCQWVSWGSIGRRFADTPQLQRIAMAVII